MAQCVKMNQYLTRNKLPAIHCEKFKGNEMTNIKVKHYVLQHKNGDRAQHTTDCHKWEVCIVPLPIGPPKPDFIIKEFNQYDPVWQSFGSYIQTERDMHEYVHGLVTALGDATAKYIELVQEPNPAPVWKEKV